RSGKVVVAGGTYGERLEDTHAACVEIAYEAIAASGMCGAFLGGAVLAGEEAGRERVIINDAELFLPADRLEFGLEFLAVGEVVERLQALVARRGLPHSCRGARPQPPGRS